MDNNNAIYLGDIDPNNSILPVMTVRRMIMFQLLVWDRIIISDSQFLTDPRLNVLMGGYNGNEVMKKYKIDDVASSYKGIEALFENGFIEVALRKNQESGSLLSNTWNGMRRSTKPVPYLPEDERYVEYLMSFRYTTHIYETANMGFMFKDKLLRGLESDPLLSRIVLSKNNDIDKELIRMFDERIPLFRNILDFLQSQRDNGKITLQRYTELYDYVYACYNVNVSETLGCNINTKFAHIPFHIESGEEFIGDNPTSEQVGNLRHTWALNPMFLDYLTFDEFVEIKNEVKKLGVGSKVREFYLGNADSSWKEIEDAWDAYTRCLELEIKERMHEKKDTVTEKVFKEYDIEKYLTKPQQKCITTPMFEAVKSCVSFDPLASAFLGPVDAVKSLCGSVITLSKAPGRVALAKEYNELSKLVQKETRVVTKY